MAYSEFLQGYSENGEPSRPLTLSEIRAGELHGASHVWIWRQENDKPIEVLLQKRNGTTWPDFWDVSTAGHIDAGESPLETASREGSEELGISLDPRALSLVGVYRWKQKAVTRPGTDEIIENEFQWVYTYRQTGRRSDEFALEAIEVQDTLWLPLEDLEDLTQGKSELGPIIDHDTEYYSSLFRHIRKQSS